MCWFMKQTYAVVGDAVLARKLHHSTNMQAEVAKEAGLNNFFSINVSARFCRKISKVKSDKMLVQFLKGSWLWLWKKVKFYIKGLLIQANYNIDKEAMNLQIGKDRHRQMMQEEKPEYTTPRSLFIQNLSKSRIPRHTSKWLPPSKEKSLLTEMFKW